MFKLHSSVFFSLVLRVKFQGHDAKLKWFSTAVMVNSM